MKPINIGIIGCGPWARKYINVLNGIPNINIRGYSRRLNKDADGFEGIKRFASPERLIETRPDGVIIAADPKYHIELIRLAQEYRVPAHVEKPVSCFPVGKASAAISEFLKDYRDSTTPVKVGYIHLWSPYYQIIQKICSNQKIKKIVSSGGNIGPYRNFSSLYDYGSHDISMIASLLAHPDRLMIEYAALCPKVKGEIYIAKLNVVEPVTFHHTEIYVHCGNGFFKKSRSFSVVLDSGKKITYDDVLVEKKLIIEPDAPITVGKSASPLELMVIGFIDAIVAYRKGKFSRSLCLEDMRTALTVTSILDSIARACETCSITIKRKIQPDRQNEKTSAETSF
jgi:predicted dehydrogenase